MIIICHAAMLSTRIVQTDSKVKKSGLVALEGSTQGTDSTAVT